MATTRTTLRAGMDDDVHAQIEELARTLEPHDYKGGAWLRELTVALAQSDELVVAVVSYDGGGQELEVRLADAAASDGLVIGRSGSGDQCQISLDLWVSIKDGPGVEQTVALARALLRASVYVPMKH